MTSYCEVEFWTCFLFWLQLFSNYFYTNYQNILIHNIRDVIMSDFWLRGSDLTANVECEKEEWLLENKQYLISSIIDNLHLNILSAKFCRPANCYCSHQLICPYSAIIFLSSPILGIKPTYQQPNNRHGCWGEVMAVELDILILSFVLTGNWVNGANYRTLIIF